MPQTTITLPDEMNDAIMAEVEDSVRIENRTQYIRYAIRSALQETERE